MSREEQFTGKIGLPAVREQFVTVNHEDEGKLVELAARSSRPRT